MYNAKLPVICKYFSICIDMLMYITPDYVRYSVDKSTIDFKRCLGSECIC